MALARYEMLGPVPHDHYTSLAGVEDRYWWHLSRLAWVERLVRRYCPSPDLLSVVDVGCGTGGFLTLLDERMGFRRSLGVDPSEQAISLALRHGENFQKIDAASYAPPADTDLVLLMDVIEHVDDDEAFLARMLDPLRPGAKLVIAVPAFQFLYSDWDRRLGHYRRYTSGQLASISARAGGSVRFVNYGFVPLLPAAWLVNLFGRNAGFTSDCAFPKVPAVVNAILTGMFGIEAAVGQRLPYPFGLSVFCVIEKSEPGAG